MVQLPPFQDPKLFTQAVTHSSYDSTEDAGTHHQSGRLVPLVPLNPAGELEDWGTAPPQPNTPGYPATASPGQGSINTAPSDPLPPGVYANERLEFLGDAVLNFLAGEFVYKRYPQKPEGELTALRSALVDERQLSAFAQELDLGRYLRLGKSAENQGVRQNTKILSCTFEAVVGAYFLDQTSQIEAVRSFVWPLFETVVDHQAVAAVKTNYKSRFQEWVQANCPGCLPVYSVVAESGPPHQRVFEVRVQVRGEDGTPQLMPTGTGAHQPAATAEPTAPNRLVWGEGQGRSKQIAEKAAAQMALGALDHLD